MAKPLIREEQGFTVQTSCAVCKRCWLHPKSRRCFYGGPFLGYVVVPATPPRDG